MKGKHKKFEPWMIHKLRQHIAEGWSYNLFAAKYRIHLKLWQEMGRDIPEIKQIKEEYNYRVCKCRSSDYWLNRNKGN